MKSILFRIQLFAHHLIGAFVWAVTGAALAGLFGLLGGLWYAAIMWLIHGDRYPFLVTVLHVVASAAAAGGILGAVTWLDGVNPLSGKMSANPPDTEDTADSRQPRSVELPAAIQERLRGVSTAADRSSSVPRGTSFN